MMHAVIETSTFLADCRRAGLSDAERLTIVTAIAENPVAGDLMKGTGGARKRRFPGRGKGKSGGYRVISYYAAEDVPVIVLALVDKGERTDLPQSEQRALRTLLTSFAPTYRAGRRRR